MEAAGEIKIKHSVLWCVWDISSVCQAVLNFNKISKWNMSVLIQVKTIWPALWGGNRNVTFSQEFVVISHFYDL